MMFNRNKGRRYKPIRGGKRLDRTDRHPKNDGESTAGEEEIKSKTGRGYGE